MASRDDSADELDPGPRVTRRTTTTRIEVDPERGVFMISVAAELAEMHPQTLRMYETRGLIQPKRSPKGTRLYSQADVERLRRIQEMTAQLGLNLAGVERVLELERELESAGARMRELEGQAEAVRAELESELDALRRSGTDVVRYRPAPSPARRNDVEPTVHIPVKRQSSEGA
jgi:MerR family transcriptional regulator/heat shock protein HspR